MKSVIFFALLFAVALPVCAQPSSGEFAARYHRLIENPEKLSEAERLHRLFDIAWEYRMVNYPESATHVGYPGQNSRWTDLSLEAIEQRKKDLQTPLRVIRSIKRDQLDAKDQLNHDLFLRNLKLVEEGLRFPSEYLQINQRGGPQTDIADMINIMPASAVPDYEDILARLGAAPKLIEQTILLLEEGRKKGVTPPKITLREVPDQIKNQVVDDPEQSPLMRPFQKFPNGISETDQARLKAEAEKVLREELIPSFGKLHEYLLGTYLPAARESVAAMDLPDGKAWYAFDVREQTTTDLTPEQIHEIGLNEVKRIRGEMEKIIRKTGFEGSFAQFTEFLRTEPRFFFEKPEDLLVAYRDIAKRIDPELPRLFGTLPRMPYGVKPIPSYSEKTQTTAYYMPGAPDAARAGYFYANTYNLKARPKWEMEALTAHEAVPGHHLQISLAQEIADLPEFRRHGGYTAFVEGWGLYAESLGEEIGLYQDPYSKFGQLTYEMWRAIRLVVDTGMHQLGWPRERAIEFFKENTGRAEHDIIVEIDRYIVWPGQALAYKLGELKFKEMKLYARERLGDRFDIREFHDTILLDGALPLELVDGKVKAWVEAKQKG